jgi:hypothetical protein
MTSWRIPRSSIVLAALVCACKQGATTPRVEPEQNRAAPTRDVVDPPPDAIVERASAPNPRIAIEPIDAATQSDSRAETEDASQRLAVEPPRPVGRNAPYRLDVENEQHCDLRLAEQGIAARCSEGTMTCTQIATGAFTAAGATDSVWDCTRPTRSVRAIALATARAVVWVNKVSRQDEFDEFCPINSVAAEPLVLGTHPTPALFLRVRDCQFGTASTSTDYDSLLLWRDGEMQTLEEAAFQCEYDGGRLTRRIGNGMSSCQGSYIVPNATGTGVNIVGYRVAVLQRGFGVDRLMKGNGHIQARLTWARVLAARSDGT